MTAALRVVDLGEDDYDAVLALWQAAGLAIKPAGRDSRAQFAAQLASGLQQVIGARSGERLVGVIVATHDGRKGWLNRLAVHPDFRRQGIARALVAEPKVLVLDEPTEGIQPSIIKELARTLVALRRDRGISILVSEQVLSFALEVADRFLVIDRGRIVDEKRRDDAGIEDIREFLKV